MEGGVVTRWQASLSHGPQMNRFGATLCTHPESMCDRAITAHLLHQLLHKSRRLCSVVCQTVPRDQAAGFEGEIQQECIHSERLCEEKMEPVGQQERGKSSKWSHKKFVSSVG